MLDSLELLERRRIAESRRRASPPATTSPRDRLRTFLAVALFAIPLLPSFAFGMQIQVHLAGIALLSLLAMHLRASAEHPARRWILRETDLGIAAIVGAAGISLLVAGSLAAATSALFPIVTLAAAYWSLRGSVRNGRDVERFTLALLGAGAILASFGILGAVRFEFALAAGTTIASDRTGWLATPFYPHSYAVAPLLAPCVPLALAQLFGSPSRRFRIVAGFALPCIATYLVLVLSRAIWLATLLGCAVVVLTSWHSILRGRSARLLFSGLVLAAIALAAGFAGDSLLLQIRQRLSSLLDPDSVSFNFSRLQVWGDSLRLATDAMPLGVGVGQFAARFAEYDSGRRFIPHAHEQFLHWLAEIGPLGCLGLVLAILSTTTAYVRRVRTAPAADPSLPATQGLLAALVTFSAICATETPLLYAPAATLLALLIGASHRLGARVSRRIAVPALLTRQRAGLTLTGLIALASLWFAVHATAGILGTCARAAAARQSHSEAISLASIATTLQPHLDWIHWTAAQSERASGDLIGAERSLVRYEELAPRVPAALMQRAEILFAHNQQALALEQLFAARLRAAPELLVEIDYQIGNCLTYLGRDEEARTLYLNLIQRGAHIRYSDLLRRTAECLKRLERDPVLEKSLRAEFAKMGERSP